MSFRAKRGIAVIPKEGDVILSDAEDPRRPVAVIESEAEDPRRPVAVILSAAKDPQVPDRGLSLGMMRILRLPAQDDKAL